MAAIAGYQFTLFAAVSAGNAELSKYVPPSNDALVELVTPYCVSTFMYGVPFMYEMKFDGMFISDCGSLTEFQPQKITYTLGAVRTFPPWLQRLFPAQVTAAAVRGASAPRAPEAAIAREKVSTRRRFRLLVRMAVFTGSKWF